MLIKSKDSEYEAALSAARAISAAARTAPKACGVDVLDTVILTGEDKDALTAKMREIGRSFGENGFYILRDADNIDASHAIVLIGAKYETRGLGKLCRLCGFEDCSAANEAGATCVFVPMDLGIALGSAVALAADLRIDNRMMFTAGKAAQALSLIGEHSMIIGIPLATSGKSPFYDREGGSPA